MPAKKAFVPKYCYHKPSGKAYCRINGKVIYLGDYDSEESKKEYSRVIGEEATNPTAASIKKSSSITVVELADAYWSHAQEYYQQSKSSLDRIRVAIRSICENYAHQPVDEFGPLALQTVRCQIVERGCSRNYANHITGAIKRIFRWGAAQELVPVVAYQALATVAGLQRGRTAARETPPVKPVPDELVDATLPFLPGIVADMVRLQRLIGCRPGEVCIIRPCDVDTTSDVWSYKPESHKTAYRGHERVIFIGPKAQDVLRPYLLREQTAYCFSPSESERRRLAQIHTERKTPLKHGNRPGTNRRKKPKKQPSELYRKHSYNQAIQRGVEKANNARREEAADMGIEPILLPHWHANQLRHSAATRIRKQFGLEAAQVILGHAKADITQVYAERDSALAVEVARKIG